MISTPTPQEWTGSLHLPLHERILPLPPAACDFVRMVNLATGVAARPEPVTPDAALRADLEAALRGMPTRVRALVEPLLLGVCIGRGLGSSGITDIVLDAENGSLLGCIVLLDADLLSAHTANSWATWKDRLPFQAGPGFSVTTTIAHGDQDTRSGALQFLLLHEFGHVVTAGGDFLPRWWEALTRMPVPGAYPFLDLSWQTTPQGRFVPRAGLDFALRDVVDFYGANRLDSESLVTAYAGLELSNFPSLYGATNPYDDFAECFAIWVHTELLGKPMSLSIDLDGEPQAWLDAFWQHPRSASKRAIMASMFGPPPDNAVRPAHPGNSGKAPAPMDCSGARPHTAPAPAR